MEGTETAWQFRVEEGKGKWGIEGCKESDNVRSWEKYHNRKRMETWEYFVWFIYLFIACHVPQRTDSPLFFWVRAWPSWKLSFSFSLGLQGGGNVTVKNCYFKTSFFLSPYVISLYFPTILNFFSSKTGQLQQICVCQCCRATLQWLTRMGRERENHKKKKKRKGKEKHDLTCNLWEVARILC